MTLSATERSSLDLVGGVNPWDIPTGSLRVVHAFPTYWEDGGKWRVEDARVASHVVCRRPRRDPMSGRRNMTGSFEVIVPVMVRTSTSPEWEVTSCGRTVCFVDKAGFPTPDHALAYALASIGWRIVP